MRLQPANWRHPSRLGSFESTRKFSSTPAARHVSNWRLASLVAITGSSMLFSHPVAAQAQPGAAGTAEWIVGGLLLGGALILDEEIRSTVPAGGGERLEPITDRLNYLGNPKYLVPVLAGGWLTGTIARSPRIASSSVHILGALLAGGAANGAVKSIVGRERPVGGDRFSFSPISFDNRWQSFPSGHAVVAFSIADAISRESGRPWVTIVSFGSASLVAWSRVYEDKHWASDAVGGAIIGVLSSRAALALAHRLDPHDVTPASIAIIATPAGLEFSVRMR